MTEFTNWLIDYYCQQSSGMNISQVVFLLWSVIWLMGFGVGFLGMFISGLFVKAAD